MINFKRIDLDIELDIKKANSKAKLAHFIVGLINNTTYVVILSASKQLVKEFNKEHLLPLYSGCLVFFSIFLRILNLKLLVKVQHKTRIYCVFIMASIGIFLIMFSIFIGNFFVCLLGTVMVGLATTFGSLTIGGHLKSFDPIVFSGYSSGTGFAGVFGSLYYFILNELNISFYINFSLLLLLYIVYIFTFLYIIQLGKFVLRFNQEKLFSSTDSEEAPSLEEQEQYLKIKESDKIEQKEASVNELLTLKNLGLVLKNILYYAVNLSGVYFFEYSIITYLSQIITVSYKYSIKGETLFQVIQIIYQIGVFISRSSLEFFKIKKIELVTLGQFSMYLLYIYFALFYQPDLIILLFFMVLVGVFGGLSYCNAFYLIYDDPKIKYSQKEISITVIALFTEIAISLNTLVGLIFLRKI